METMQYSQLEPQSVFHYFQQMSQIPHGSGDQTRVSQWVVDFAKAQGLPYRQDEMGNVVIWKKATEGYENHPTVMLQGHLDMVCVAESGKNHDFTRDPLTLVVDGDWLRADGTTLGGDNGIAVAMTMAILADNTLRHPPIEAVFTVDEEIGLLGATGLSCEDLQSRYLINLDSEDEGVLTAGCAGGARCDIEVSFATELHRGTGCRLSVAGLNGGHSGIEINRGFANGTKLLGEVLEKLSAIAPLYLQTVWGGTQDNAIPKDAYADFFTEANDISALQTALADWEQELKNRFPAEPNLTLTLTVGETAEKKVLTADESRRFAKLLNAYPNGVLEMNPYIEGLVKTSLNLGITRLEDGVCHLSASIRYGDLAGKERMTGELQALAQDFGGSYGIRGEYPAWEFMPQSPLRDTMAEVYRQQYGKEMIVETIHAGLECGILVNRMAGLDAVSIGPDLRDVHSTRERLSISSTERVWQFVKGVLEAL